MPSHTGSLVRDISGWHVLEVPTTGAREKFWCVDPHGDQWLFKYSREYTGEHWAEYLASRILLRMDLPAADVEIASHHGRIGSIAKKFVNPGPEQFYEGVDLLGLGSSTSIRSNLSQYTLDGILASLQPYGLASEFLAVPLFDALVGHVDRHPGNWGIIETVDHRTYRLAPVYDNSACLGAELLLKRLELFELDGTAYEAYLRRPRTLIRLEPGRQGAKHLDLAMHIKQHYPDEFDRYGDRLTLLTDDAIRSMVEPLSLTETPKRIDFLNKVLIHRRDKILRLRDR